MLSKIRRWISSLAMSRNWIKIVGLLLLKSLTGFSKKTPKSIWRAGDSRIAPTLMGGFEERLEVLLKCNNAAL
jgi:hypothetical protein